MLLLTATKLRHTITLSAKASPIHAKSQVIRSRLLSGAQENTGGGQSIDREKSVNPFDVGDANNGEALGLVLRMNEFDTYPLPPPPVTPSPKARRPSRQVSLSRSPSLLQSRQPNNPASVPLPPPPVTPPPNAHSPRNTSSPSPVPSVHQSKRPKTPASVGRLEAKLEKVLEDGFVEIDVIVGRLAQESKLSPEQVESRLRRRNEPSAHILNMWNIYQAYHKANLSEEMARLDDGGDIPGKSRNRYRQFATNSLRMIENEINSSHRRECYELFKSEFPDTYAEILQMESSVLKLSNAPSTLQERTRYFKRMFKTVTHLVRGLRQYGSYISNHDALLQLDSWHIKHGFEAALVLCGTKVHEDGGLTAEHTTAGAKDVSNSTVY